MRAAKRIDNLAKTEIKLTLFAREIVDFSDLILLLTSQKEFSVGIQAAGTHTNAAHLCSHTSRAFRLTSMVWQRTPARGLVDSRVLNAADCSRCSRSFSSPWLAAGFAWSGARFTGSPHHHLQIISRFCFRLDFFKKAASSATQVHPPAPGIEAIFSLK